MGKVGDKCREISPETIINRLKELGYKLTYTRIEIIREIIARGSEHPTIVSIYESLKKKMPSLSFTTVYNTVRLLEEHGMLWIFELGGDRRIDLVTEPHINIIYIDTGIIVDYCGKGVEKLREIISEVEKELGVKPSSIIVNLAVRTRENTKEQRIM